MHDSAGEAEAGSLRIVRDSNSSEYYLSYRAARMGKYYAVHNLVDSEGYIDTTKSRVSLSYDSWDLAYFGEYIYFTVQPGPKEVTRLMRVDKKGVYEEKQKYNDKQALIVVR